MTTRIGGGAPWFARAVDQVADKILDLDRGRPTKLGGPLETQDWLKKNYSEWFHDSPRTAEGKYVADPTPWPDPAFGPGAPGTTVFVHNEKTVAASPEKVMATIQDGTHWSQVCDNLADAKIEGGGTTLQAGTKFNWTTFASNLNGQIVELDTKKVPMVIGWRAKDPKTNGANIDVYHRYLLYPDGKGGTRIVTEESQRGGLTRPLPVINPNQEKMMLAGHQYLLDCIDKATQKSGDSWSP
jgi:hypothetical protein